MTLPEHPAELARLIDSTLLNAMATRQDIEKLCRDARTHQFRGVVVNGSRVLQAAALLEDAEVKIVAVAGFPLGAMESDAKRFETEVAVDNGAQEIEVVMNLGWLKEGNDAANLRELRDVMEAAEERPVGVMVETGLLTDAEKIRAAQLVIESGGKSVVIGTGFIGGVPTEEDARLLRDTLGEKPGVKAAGNVRDARAALALLAGGATRVGSSEALRLLRSL